MQEPKTVLNQLKPLNKILLRFSEKQSIENTKQSIELPKPSFLKSFSKHTKCKKSIEFISK